MGRGVDVVRRQEWQKWFQRFSELRLTVAEFCQWEGVSVATFYNGRRKCESNQDGWDRETRLTVTLRLPL